jgi:hypothetical protein
VARDHEAPLERRATETAQCLVDDRHVGRGAPWHLRGGLHADVSAGSGFVLDDDWLAQRWRQTLRHPTDADIARAAGRGRSDDPDRTRSPGAAKARLDRKVMNQAPPKPEQGNRRTADGVLERDELRSMRRRLDCLPKSA